MTAGKLCAGCTTNRCVECPTDQDPCCIDCPECDGKGCEQCQERGQFLLTECPYKTHLTPEVCELVYFANLYKKGVPPVAGGALDQSAWFMEACNAFWRDQEALSATRWPEMT